LTCEILPRPRNSRNEKKGGGIGKRGHNIFSDLQEAPYLGERRKRSRALAVIRKGSPGEKRERKGDVEEGARGREQGPLSGLPERERKNRALRKRGGLDEKNPASEGVSAKEVERHPRSPRLDQRESESHKKKEVPKRGEKGSTCIG